MRISIVCACGFSATTPAAGPTPASTPTSAGEKHIWRGQLRVGTAKIDITPENTKEPVHDRVQARALVLEVGTNRLAFIPSTCSFWPRLSFLAFSPAHTIFPRIRPGHPAAVC